MKVVRVKMPRNLRVRNGQVVTKDNCRFELSAMSSTNATGIFVINAYLMSTSLCSRWSNMANLFNRWRIVKIVLHYVSQIATTNNGRVGMAFSADADSGTPTSFSNLIEMRRTKECAGRQNMSLLVRPQHEYWLWTADLSLNEDRLEYPGIIYVASGSFTSALVPGYVWCEALTEWCEPTNSTVALSRQARLLGKPGTTEVPVDSVNSKDEKEDDLRMLMTALARHLLGPARDAAKQDSTVPDAPVKGQTG